MRRLMSAEFFEACEETVLVPHSLKIPPPVFLERFYQIIGSSVCNSETGIFV
jgi:hypothetical protein